MVQQTAKKKAQKKAFRDRQDAGRRLAAECEWLRGQDVVVLALPRGGVPVALEVAAALGAPLDVLGVARVCLPGRPELAMGAVAEGGVTVVLDEVVRLAGVARLPLAQAQQHAREALDAQVEGYRDVAAHVPLAGRVALIVDDGATTGASLRAACRVARARQAERVVVAVPVGAPEVLAVLEEEEADVVRALYAPKDFAALEDWYDDLAPLNDEQVRVLLAQASGLALDVIDLTAVEGDVTPADQAKGLVVLAGDGLARIATTLHDDGWTTLTLADLDAAEDQAGERLLAATRSALGHPACAGLPVGWVGSGAAVQVLLQAAAELGAPVDAIVGRDGRPDLARAALPHVVAPTLLLVGARDRRGMEHGRQAMAWLRCESDLRAVSGTTKPFGEPDPEGVAGELVASWFAAHLTRVGVGRH
jgi:putative phosphoribosyl transferase